MPLVPKRKRSSQEIRSELKKIYVEKDGNMPNLSRMQKQSSSRSTRFLLKLIGVLLFISVVAWGGFFLWTQTIFKNGDDLNVLIDGPDSAKAGETVYYTVVYENIARTSLENLTLTLHLPETFTITQSSPEPTQAERWDLGTMTPTSDGKIMIGGVFRSEVGSSQTLQALVTYRPGNTHADFQTLESKKVTIESSVLETTLSGPATALTGDEVTYTVTLQNTSDSPVSNVATTLLVPEGFEIASAEPVQEMDEEEKPLLPPVWKFSELAPKEPQTITIKGQYIATMEGTQTITAQALFLKEDDTTTIQQSQEVVTEVIQGALVFHFILNGSTESQTTTLGKNLRGSIDFENTSPETMEDLSFVLTVDSEKGLTPIDWTQADLGGGEKQGATITWSRDQLIELAEIEGEGKGVIDFTLPLGTEINLETQSDVFTLTLEATTKKAGETTDDRTVQTSPMTITLLSDTMLNAQTRYYLDDGTPVGTGSIPPNVGEVSSYGVLWTLTNSLHPLENITISTTLPSHVNWTDQAVANVGTITYDPVTRVMTWTIPSLPTSITQTQAWFGVGFTPTSDDVGTFLKLTNPSSLTATDTAVSTPLSTSTGSLTTDLSDDPSVTGTGVVVE